MPCIIEGCDAKPIAKGLCWRHYARQRRTGNPAVRGTPGRRPVAARVDAGASDVAALQAQIAALRAQNATLLARQTALHQQLAEARAAKPRPLKPPPPLREANEDIAALRQQVRDYRARLRKIADTPHGTLRVTKKDYLAVLRCLQPDTEVDPVKKKRLNHAFHLVENWKIEKVDPE